MCISVDLPDPDGPITAVNSPRSTVTETPSRARTSASPLPYTLLTLSRRSTSSTARSAPAATAAAATGADAAATAAEQCAAAVVPRGGGHGARHRGDDHLVAGVEAGQGLGPQRLPGAHGPRPR